MVTQGPARLAEIIEAEINPFLERSSGDRRAQYQQLLRVQNGIIAHLREIGK